jgi:succinyl-CoA synthetase beta subunit
MNLLEHEGKKIFQKYGIPIPQGTVATTPQAARDATAELSGEVVLKAQLAAGGRGKAGGIRFAKSPAEAEKEAINLLGRHIKGIEVKTLLVERRLEGQKEFYAGITIDDRLGKPVILCTSHGGMEVEELSRTSELFRFPFHPSHGAFGYQVRSFAYRHFSDKNIASRLVPVLESLIRMFIEKDLTLVEINPLILTLEEGFVAADAKVVVDDNALFRQPEMRTLEEESYEDPLEREASRRGFYYVHLDGDIGVLTHGAGIGMFTVDMIRKKGGKPANFLDIKGQDRAKVREQAGLMEKRMRVELEIVYSNPAIKAVLFNTFAGIGRCDEVAKGIRKYVEENPLRVPLVVRLAGTNAREGFEILKGLPVILAESLGEAVEAAMKAGGQNGNIG